MSIADAPRITNDSTPTSDDNFLTLADAAGLGYGSVYRIRRLIKEGLIPAYTLNAKYVVLESDLKAVVDKPVGSDVPNFADFVSDLETAWGKMLPREKAGWAAMVAKRLPADSPQLLSA